MWQQSKESDFLSMPNTIAYYPKRHLAPLPNPGTNSWQNDGQNYVYDRTNKVWRTWALGNPNWKQTDGFPDTSWIAYKGATLDTMEPDGVYIQGAASLNNSFWSGSCFVDWENRLGRGKGYVYNFVSGPAPFKQGISLLVADRLGKTPRNLGMCCPPEIIPAELYDGSDFRDCRVFYDTEYKQLVMAATIGLSFVFLSSQDGTKWKFLSHMRGPGSGNDLVECPNIYKLPIYDADGEDTGERKYTLIGSIQGKTEDYTVTGESCVAWTGTWDGVNFTPDTIQPQTLDYGPDAYSAVGGQKDEDSPVNFGCWLGNWIYALKPSPYKAFQNIQGFPRTIWIQEEIDGDYRVYTKPVDITLMDDTVINTYDETTIGKTVKDVFSINPGEAYKLELTLTKVGEAWPENITVGFHTGVSNRRRYHTDLKILKDGTVTYNRVAAGHTYPGYPDVPDKAWTDEYSIPAEIGVTDGDIITLEAIVDTSSVESFFNGGQTSLGGLTFPPKGCTNLDISASSEVTVSVKTTSL